MLARLALLFIVLPIVDLTILIRLGGAIGFWPTLAMVLLTGAAGAALARAEGTRVLLNARRELAEGRVPSGALLDGMTIMAGGILLLTPGFISDVIGLFLLLPPTRRWVKGWLRRWMEDQIRTGKIHVGALGPEGLVIRTETSSGERTETRLDPRNEIHDARTEVRNARGEIKGPSGDR